MLTIALVICVGIQTPRQQVDVAGQRVTQAHVCAHVCAHVGWVVGVRSVGYTDSRRAHLCRVVGMGSVGYTG